MTEEAPTDIPTIGEIVRAWREFRGLRPTELAQKAQIRKGYLSELEHNKTANPKPEQLAKLAGALDISVIDLLARKVPSEATEAEEADFVFPAPIHIPQHRSSEREKEQLRQILARVNELQDLIEALIAEKG